MLKLAKFERYLVFKNLASRIRALKQYIESDSGLHEHLLYKLMTVIDLVLCQTFGVLP